MKLNSYRQCPICNELACGKGTRLAKALGHPEISNAVLAVSEKFSIIPSVGPLVLGHSLVVTRRHSTNIIADLRGIELEELKVICIQFLQHLRTAIDHDITLFCFEHGSRCDSGNQLCSTNHGHLHLLPLRGDQISAVTAKLGSELLTFKNLPELCDVLTPLQQYIVAFSLGLGSTEVLGTVLEASNAPSQHVRRVVGETLGIACWDWKTDMNRDLLRRTLALGFALNKTVGIEPQSFAGSANPQDHRGHLTVAVAENGADDRT